jgi:2-methylcitrate dehydratase PrpD
MPSLGEMRFVSGVAVAAGMEVDVGMAVSVAVADMGVDEGTLVTSGVAAGADWQAARNRKKRGNIFFIIG